MTTRTTETSHLIYARVAGFTFLFYIAAGITSLALAGRTNVTDVLALLTSFSALVLGVTLYMITRGQGPALAMLALTCRLCCRQHALLLAPRARPSNPRGAGLARRVCVGSACRDPSSATRRTVRRPYKLVSIGHLARVVADVGVRSDVRAVAAHQRGRRADQPL